VWSIPSEAVRKAALSVLFVPVVLSFAGLVLLLIGYRTAGYVLLVGGIVVRVVFYFVARFQERSAKRS